VAQNNRDSQGYQLGAKSLVLKVRLEFSKFAAVTEHQQTEAVHFSQRKSHRVGVFQNVGPVLVVITVRNMASNFVELRGPMEFSKMSLAQLLIGG
jgi:hypothetical protein